jgi:hypothetical protein
MKGEWCFYKSYFSPDYCNLIVEKSKNLTFQTANLGEGGLSLNNRHRKSNDVLVTKILKMVFMVQLKLSRILKTGDVQ